MKAKTFFLLGLFWTFAVSSSWAWRGGFRGGGIGLYLGGPWVVGGPYYDPYYNDPYYAPAPYYPAYPYPYYQPYGAPPAPANQNTYQDQTPAAPDNSRQDLKLINRQISRAHNEADYAYEDGDISRQDYNEEIGRLKQIFKEARAEAKANGGYLTGDQENTLSALIRNGGSVSDFSSESSETAAPAVPSRELKKVNDQMAELRSLLGKKVADGDITKAQAGGMSSYLSKLEKQVQSDASANDGALTPDQENAVLQQLSRARDSITQNFVVQ